MKILKRILLVVFLLVLIGSAVGFYYFKSKWVPLPNALTVSSGKGIIPWVWTNAESSKRTALLIPIKFTGVDHTFYLQFDTGSPSSLVYHKPLQSIQQKYPQFKINRIPDAPKYLANLEFSLDKVVVKSAKMSILDYGKFIDWKKPNRKIIVGTLGNDFLEKKKILLNFKTSTLVIFDKLSSDLRSKLHLVDFSFTDRRIYVMGQMSGNSVKLMYDSGASAYSLITDHKTWKKLMAPQSKIITHQGNSWGNKLQVRTAPSQYHIIFDNLRLPLHTVTYIDGTHWTQNLLMRLSGMAGMIGNEIFRNQSVYIDAQHKQFALVK